MIKSVFLLPLADMSAMNVSFFLSPNCIKILNDSILATLVHKQYTKHNTHVTTPQDPNIIFLMVLLSLKMKSGSGTTLSYSADRRTISMSPFSISSPVNTFSRPPGQSCTRIQLQSTTDSSTHPSPLNVNV